MTTSDGFESLLEKVRWRKRLARAVSWGVRGSAAGLVAAVAGAVAIAASGAGLTLAMTLGLAAAGGVGGALIGALTGLLTQVDALVAARAIDRVSSGEDRFASALDLRNHPERSRWALIRQDAMRCAQSVDVRQAAPLRIPRAARAIPLALVALGLTFWLAPGPAVQAEPPAPEVSADEWRQLAAEFRGDIEKLPEALSEEDRAIQESLRRLAELMEQSPDKKHALTELAKLRSQIEQRQAKLRAPSTPVRQAARAMSSKMLSEFSKALQRGDYNDAARSLEDLASKLGAGELAPSAEEYTEAAQDLESLAELLKDQQELSEACEECSGAAGQMNRQQMAEALKRFSQRLRENSDRLSQCDGMCDASEALNRLVDKLGQRRGQGQGSALVKRNDNKGGEKAGWGTADDFTGGKLDEAAVATQPDMIDAPERAGASTRLRTVSPEERATASQGFRNDYVEMIKKAEADLQLESVPVAQREYLRRYFVGLRQMLETQETEPAPDSENPPPASAG